MATVLLQLRKSFPRARGLAAYTPHYQGSGSNIPGLRGLGAPGRRPMMQPNEATTSQAPSGTTNSWGTVYTPVNPFVASAPSTGNVVNANQTSYGAPSWGRSRQVGAWNSSGNGAGGGQNWASQGQNSDAPTQTDIAAFNAALENASALGVITSTQAAQLQAQATQDTDEQLQNLTSQINSLVSSTPSASAAASTSNSAQAATAATTSTSWWSGSTSLFGATVSNSTLAIGAGLAAVALWAAFKKK